MTPICSSLHSGLFFFALTKNSFTLCSNWSMASTANGRSELPGQVCPRHYSYGFILCMHVEEFISICTSMLTRRADITCGVCGPEGLWLKLPVNRTTSNTSVVPNPFPLLYPQINFTLPGTHAHVHYTSWPMVSLVFSNTPYGKYPPKFILVHVLVSKTVSVYVASYSHMKEKKKL